MAKRRHHRGSNARRKEDVRRAAGLHCWPTAEAEGGNDVEGRVKIPALSFHLKLEADLDGWALGPSRAGTRGLDVAHHYDVHFVKTFEPDLNLRDYPKAWDILQSGNQYNIIPSGSIGQAANNRDLLGLFANCYRHDPQPDEPNHVTLVDAEAGGCRKFLAFLDRFRLNAQDLRLTFFNVFEVVFPDQTERPETDRLSAVIGAPLANGVTFEPIRRVLDFVEAVRPLGRRLPPDSRRPPYQWGCVERALYLSLRRSVSVPEWAKGRTPPLRALNMRYEFGISPVAVCRRQPPTESGRSDHEFEYEVPAKGMSCVHPGDRLLFIYPGHPNPSSRLEVPVSYLPKLKQLRDPLRLERLLPFDPSVVLPQRLRRLDLRPVPPLQFSDAEEDDVSD